MPATTLKRHPVRGAIWGLLFGTGLGLLLMVMAIVPLSITTLIIYAVVNTSLGAAWGMFAPAKKPKGAPVALEPPPAPMS
ncbi:MAG: hypothetical protein A2Z12_01405 [Actinobacteria bacterium RBG_16_68_21]|nr:MAG: hypothetical protein A2Z12_01405 [Actinobacteria bacterium RBG_16_68_21]